MYTCMCVVSKKDPQQKIGNNLLVANNASIKIFKSSFDVNNDTDVFGSLFLFGSRMKANNLNIHNGGKGKLANSNLELGNNAEVKGELNTKDSSVNVKNNMTISGRMMAENLVMSVKNSFTILSSGVLDASGNTTIESRKVSHNGAIHVRKDATLQMKAKASFFSSYHSIMKGREGKISIEGSTVDVNSYGNVRDLHLKGDNIVGVDDFLYGSDKKQRLKVSNNIALEKNVGSFDITQALSRDCGISLIAPMINVSNNIYSAKNVMLKSTSEVIKIINSKVDGQNTILDSAKAIEAAGSEVYGRENLMMKAVGDIVNKCTEANVGNKKKWKKGKFSAGKSMTIESKEGSIVNDASDLKCENGDIRIKSKLGVQFLARTHTYMSEKSEDKTILRSTTTTKTKTSFAACDVTAGGNILIKTEGDFKSVGTEFKAGNEFLADVKGEASLAGLVLSESEEKTESCIIRSKSLKTTGVKFENGGNLDITAENAIFERQILNN
ncbi:hypothetical protein RFI_24394, partial [Reticulomyxa filosa]